MEHIFTPNASKCYKLCCSIALRNDCLFIGTEHLLLALLKLETDSPSGNRVVGWLKGLDCDIDGLEKKLKELVTLTAKSSDPKRQFSTNLSRAFEIAKHLGTAPEGSGVTSQITTELFLLGILWSASEMPNAAASALKSSCPESVDVFAELKKAMKVDGPEVSANMPPRPTGASQSVHISEVGPENVGAEKQRAVPPFPTILNTDTQTEAFATDVDGTHWVVPGRIMCGSSAGRMRPNELSTLLSAGVDTFVCLQESYTEYGCGDYRRVLGKLSKTKVRCIHCPIPDFGVIADQSLLTLVAELKQLLLTKDAVLYVHCYGGHGRTGTVLTNLLQSLFGISWQNALAHMKRCHKARGCTYSCALLRGKLEDEEQTEQAKRVAGANARSHKTK
uniref:Tyrosine specific protein phosphatases domain-containing protein n=1 Tax=Chromera velia CCMP2878 TaxID=1169474 RepID=A0A0G4ICY8_9ALVE|eukprot:Cvel_2289.t1-p1 / transcript=Cvel_2289.t1 / gene=Cvel_2289 / organism=Chromera_velia_CCMP2878 / gene_product=hypothetical protein / transcript_product=hypothetical protein / location=Cvel_scaffold88:115639-116808(-) / protein_length=390 / sequence_SO=supercontig / SO=protein_coding / is_pseudo=false